MKIGGFVKNSFVDYPNNIAAVIFTSGCNFSCWFCHNQSLICGKQEEKISLEEIYEFLENRKNFLDGVVISGGEPTLQSDLKDVIVKIKSMGYKVKLDTNGSNPEILKMLLDENLLDYVAMDIKEPLEKYSIFGANFEKKVKNSVNILKNCNILYEFRTTFEPELSLIDMEKIAKEISGAKKYALQKYNAPNDAIKKIPHSKNEFDLAFIEAKKFVNEVVMRY